jgi:hypothetical protein
VSEIVAADARARVASADEPLGRGPDRPDVALAGHRPGTPATVSAVHMAAYLLSYLDPGSGSMILQMIAGGTAALAVSAKLYWRRVAKFLRIRKSDDDDDH